MTPAPRAWHQMLVLRLAWGPDLLLQPDVFVAPVEQARRSTEAPFATCCRSRRC
ncbi:MAG TPA: hypothetical protein VEB59_16285 [Gemmatimonadales bacterium]|nr:hypothetical protein [Gemmatimonadales bacterium]